jgi:hypothetical protein
LDVYLFLNPDQISSNSPRDNSSNSQTLFWHLVPGEIHGLRSQ